MSYNTWATKTVIPVVKFAAAVGVIGTKLYVAGGSGPDATLYEWDQGGNSWTAKTSMTTAEASINGAVIGTKLYVAGNNVTTFYQYDQAGNSWSTKAVLPSSRSYPGVAAIGTKVYAVGGTDSGGSVTATLYEWDQAGNSWATKTAMPAALAAPAVGVIGTRLYVAGGLNASTNVATLYEWDQGTNTWATLASMPATRDRAACAVVGTQLYVMGGRDSTFTATSTLYQWDQGTNAWATMAAMPAARFGLAGGTISQKIYAVGGSGATSLYEWDSASSPSASTLTAPVGNVTIDYTISQAFTWTFADADPLATQSSADLRYRIIGAGSWTTIASAATTAGTHTFASNTFTTGSYEWQVLTYDQLGAAGPWTASSFFTGAAPPSAPTITSPTVGATISNATTPVVWTAGSQGSYEVRKVADNAGSPDTGTIYSDTGEVVDSITRSLPLTFPTNNRWEHLQVRVKVSGLWSTYGSVRVDVAYTPPATPTAVVVAAASNVAVSATHPTPSGGQPTVTSFDVYRRVVGDTSAGIRVAAGVSPLATFTDWSVASGVAYQYEVLDQASSNGSSTASTWVT